jgi:hypothetical protein
MIKKNKLKSILTQGTILTIFLAVLAMSSCGTKTSSISAEKTVVQPSVDSEEELSSWDKFYTLPEKEQVYMAKKDDPETYSKLDYASWDEYEVLKFM